MAPHNASSSESMIKRIERLVSELQTARGEKPPKVSTWGPLKFDTGVVSVLAIIHMMMVGVNAYLWMPAVLKQPFYEYNSSLWSLNIGAAGTILLLQMALAIHYDIKDPTSDDVPPRSIATLLYACFAIFFLTALSGWWAGMMILLGLSTLFCFAYIPEAWLRRLGETEDGEKAWQEYSERKRAVDQDPRTPLIERLERTLDGLRGLEQIAEEDTFFDIFQDDEVDCRREIETLHGDTGIGQAVTALERSLEQKELGKVSTPKGRADAIEAIEDGGFVSTANGAALERLRRAATSNQVRAERIRGKG